jgi:pseudouridine kinase
MRIACIGGAHIDRHGMLKRPLVPATSNPGNVTCSFGGVARNVAENLARLGRKVTLVSRVGDDEAGRQLLSHLTSLGVDVSRVSVASRPTGTYTAILQPDGELVLGLADMDLYDEISPAILESALPHLCECDGWFVDANLPSETLEWLAAHHGSRWLAADAVSVPKASRLSGILGEISTLFLNRAQAAVLDVGQCRSGVMTLGADGLVAWVASERRTMPALPATPRDVTGAGDALIAGTIFGLTDGLALFEAAKLGLAAAAITLEVPDSVNPQLTAERLADPNCKIHL